MPAAALAQEVATTSTADADLVDNADVGDGNVIVTAQGRQQVLSDVPVAVSAETLERSGVADIRDVNQVAPSLLFSSTGNEANGSARIRGTGTVGDNPGLESSVAVFVDGVYRSRSGSRLGQHRRCIQSDQRKLRRLHTQHLPHHRSPRSDLRPSVYERNQGFRCRVQQRQYHLSAEPSAAQQSSRNPAGRPRRRLDFAKLSGQLDGVTLSDTRDEDYRNGPGAQRLGPFVLLVYAMALRANRCRLAPATAAPALAGPVPQPLRRALRSHRRRGAPPAR